MQERFKRGDIEQIMAEADELLKFQKPFKVYMKFIDGRSKGTEALYVKGSYKNKLLVRQAGILGLLTLSLDPKGSLAMARKRHPVTEVGFGFLLDEFRRHIEPASGRENSKCCG